MFFGTLAEAGHEVTATLLRDWSERVPLEARVSFSRHRGQYWHEVPRDYLGWLLRNHRSGEPFAPEIVAAAEAASGVSTPCRRSRLTPAPTCDSAARRNVRTAGFSVCRLRSA